MSDHRAEHTDAWSEPTAGYATVGYAPDGEAAHESTAPAAVTPADAADAARLVAFGLQPKLLPARDAEYAELLRRYREETPSPGSPTPWPPGSVSSYWRCPPGRAWP